MRYYDLMKDMATKFNLRLEMVLSAREHGLSEAARRYRTTRKTLRKWHCRYQAQGLDGLKDQKRTPKSIPHKMDRDTEAKVIAARQKLHTFGARPLKDRLGIAYSHSAIHRVLKQNGLCDKRKRRHRKRKDLSELKKTLAFFQKSQIDTKDLSDILKYWPLMRRLGLPRYEYALRELSTGLCFFAYADENTTTNASKFADYVAEHLKRHGIKTARIQWQSDNGSEYIGNVRKKTNRKSAFEKTLIRHEIDHGRIPPRCSWLQGDVETFNRIVENEFFDIESFGSEQDFLGKAYSYQLYFNYARKNRYRGNKSPIKILRQRFPDVDEDVLNLPPIHLDSWEESLVAEGGESGYHVPWPAPIV
ncbi:MAG: transposase [Candidatus Omnitrophica bacterium]|nr:transposase [Candidatus Omnitrophota bacterium]